MRYPAKVAQRRGNVMMEGAICLLVILAFLLGAADISKVMFLHQGLVERARAGAKWASTQPFDATEVKNVVVFGSATPGNGANTMLYNLQTSHVSATLLDANSTRARVEVKIQNYPFEFWMPWLTGSFTARPIEATLTHEPSLP
jgi:Flp pilus assembly protein TadG